EMVRACRADRADRCTGRPDAAGPFSKSSLRRLSRLSKRQRRKSTNPSCGPLPCGPRSCDDYSRPGCASLRKPRPEPTDTGGRVMFKHVASARRAIALAVIALFLGAGLARAQHGGHGGGGHGGGGHGGGGHA